MNWHSIGEFLAMGGYASYVWGSFGMCALVLAVEVAAVAQRRRGLRHLPLADDADVSERPVHEA